jgi:integrase
MRTPTEYVAKNGARTWKVKFRLTPGRAGKTTSETFTDRVQAEKFCRLLDAVGPAAALKMLYDAEERSGAPTMDELAADHIEHLTGIEPGTRLTYERLWDRTWSEHLGAIRADQLTRDHVAAATNRLAVRYSGKSLKNQRGLLAGVCDRAVDLGYLPANPTKRLRLPRGNEHERPEMQCLTREQFARLDENMHAHYRLFVRFLAATGCRYGEAVALTRADLKLDQGTALIRRALKWSPDNDRRVGVTKTRKSNRTVALPAELIDQLRARTAARAPADLVFTAPRGGPINHRTFWSDIWLPACTAAGLDPRPRIHDLRHTHVSWLLAAGVPIHVVQARLGHESITTTVDTYGHLLPDAQLAAAQAAAAAFTPLQLES